MANTKKKTVKSSPKAKKKTVAKKKTPSKKAVKKKTVAKKKIVPKKVVPTKKKAVAKKKIASKKAVPAKKKVVKKAPTKKATKKVSISKKATVKKTIKKKTITRKKTVQKAPKMSKGMASIAKRPVVMPRTIPGKRKKITAKDKKILKAHLIAMSKQFAEKVDHLKKNSLVRNDSVISPEDGTDVFDRQFNLSLASTEQKSLAAIYDALKRIEEGTYGTCDSCGDIIGIARLKALPFVKMCINCKSDFEKDRARPRVYQ